MNRNEGKKLVKPSRYFKIDETILYPLHKSEKDDMDYGQLKRKFRRQTRRTYKRKRREKRRKTEREKERQRDGEIDRKRDQKFIIS